MAIYDIILHWDTLTSCEPLLSNNGGGLFIEPRHSYDNDEYIPLHSYDLITQCWVESPAERYSFEEITEIVNALLEDVAGYIDFSAVCSGVYETASASSQEEVNTD